MVHNFVMTLFYIKRSMFPVTSKCVASCPTSLSVPTVSEHMCSDEVVVTSPQDLDNGIRQGKCLPLNLPTFECISNFNPLVYRYCLPDMGALANSFPNNPQVVAFTKTLPVYVSFLVKMAK
ncbi:hypothetical protein HZS_1088, partial [Henneguya salminicola]